MLVRLNEREVDTLMGYDISNGANKSIKMDVLQSLERIIKNLR